MSDLLRQQNVFITGGGTGIGREIALALGGAGGRIALLGRRRDKLQRVTSELEAASVEAMALPGDVRDAASIQHAVESVESKWGGIDILVNNAATFARGKLLEVDPSDWKNVIETNLFGAFLTTRAVVPGMLKKGRGSVLFISSTSGKRGDPKMSAYAASKHGLMGMAHAFLYEMRPHDIRVIVVSPSAIDTNPELPDAEKIKGVTAHASDVAQTVLHCVTLPGRALIRDVEIWGTNP